MGQHIFWSWGEALLGAREGSEWYMQISAMEPSEGSSIQSELQVPSLALKERALSETTLVSVQLVI